MKLEIKYSLEFEIKRVLGVLKKKDNYKWINYNSIRLPKGADTKLSDKEIEKLVLKEYDEQKYIAASKKLMSMWEQESKIIAEKLRICNLSFKDKYKVILTKYGAVGSFNLPNIIVLNIKTKRDFISIVVHEMIHTIFEELFSKYELGYIEREITMDLICSEILMKRYKKQCVYEENRKESKKIEKIFKKHFHNIPEFIRIICNSPVCAGRKHSDNNS